MSLVKDDINNDIKNAVNLPVKKNGDLSRHSSNDVKNNAVNLPDKHNDNSKINWKKDSDIKDNDIKDNATKDNTTLGSLSASKALCNEIISVNLDNIADVCTEWIHLQTPEEIKEFGNYLPKRKLINFFIREFTRVRLPIVGVNHFEDYEIKRQNDKIRFILSSNFNERCIWTRSSKKYNEFWNKYKKPRWQSFRKYLFKDDEKSSKDEILDFLIDFLMKRVEINKCS